MVASVGQRGRVPALAKYEVLEELGHGGMATVYRAHDPRLARDVAVKVLHPHLKESSEIAHRFAVEARAVAKLRHPNIVEVFDVSSEEDVEQFLVVELVRGETLRKALQTKGPMPPEVGAAVALELLSALQCAHERGVVHRDVKPENVLLEHPRLAPEATPSTPSPSSVKGDRVVVKLTDFGIAKLLDAQGVTSTGQVLGSPAHMAPEQIEGGEVDGRADVFGLGVLLYECIVGHLPFEGNNPAQVLRRVLDGTYPSAERERPTIGRVFSEVLDRALAQRPMDRFLDATAMKLALTAELERVGVTSPRAELEAWFDDPEAWSKEHDAKLIARLSELGAAARRRGDAVSAAADYNRALAYAPDDPQLLRVVASMHAAEARRRFLKKLVPLVGAAIFLGTGAFVAARSLRASPPSPPQRVVHPATAASTPRVTPSIVPPLPPATAVATAHPTTAATTSTPAKSFKRMVTFAKLSPPFGLHLTVDGARVTDPTTGGTITVDEHAHTFVFTCERDLCEPSTSVVPAGETDDSLIVDLRILPAKLLIEGDTTHSYAIEEMPQVAVTVGTAAEIPIRQGRATVTVFDRADPAKRKSVLLEAGRAARVSFE